MKILSSRSNKLDLNSADREFVDSLTDDNVSSLNKIKKNAEEAKSHHRLSNAAKRAWNKDAR